MEILQVDKTLEGMITKDSSSNEILHYAHSKGMLSMLDDGYRKVLEGKTTFEEIHRVVLDRAFLEQ
jgi:type II secretory ATPase GspE/PulE/Tfp pilus assembly ATPase PilB-like protein